jgi:signal transduction histidine kinase
VTNAQEVASRATRLAVVVHELRSPVAAIASLAESAPHVHDPDDRRRLLRLAIAAARDIDRILADPELFSLRLERVDVGALASGFSSDAVVVRVTGHPTATGDPTRLRQAIGNLVTNALRHGTRVAIDVTDGDGVVSIDVTDDGPGIDSGIDPFARGVSGVGSSGVGLWIARAVAEAHGGSLETVAHANRGACLRLALPSASGAG